MKDRDFIVVVTGGRDYSQWETARRALEDFHERHPIIVLAHGGARGADLLAANWAIQKHITEFPYPVSRAEWEMYGKPAGPHRNGRMLRERRPDAVLAFPGGSGTKDCCNQARRMGIPIFTLNANGLFEREPQEGIF